MAKKWVGFYQNCAAGIAEMKSRFNSTNRRYLRGVGILLLIASAGASAQQLTINKFLMSPATAGQIATFEIEVENNTGAAADGATVSDALSGSFNGTSIVTACLSNINGATCPTYSISGNNLVATIATFPNTGKVRFQINVKVNSNAGNTSTTNNAVATYVLTTSNGPVTFTSNSSVGVPIATGPQPTLTITKTQSTPNFALNSPITYTVEVANTSGVEAVGYSIADQAFITSNAGTAPNVAFTVNSANPVPCVSLLGAACPASPQIPSAPTVSVNGSISSLFSSSALVIPANTKWRFTYTITPTAIAGGCGFSSITLSNRALVSGASTPYVTTSAISGLTSNICQVGPVYVPLDVGVTKTGVLGTSSAGLPQVTYTIVVTNYEASELANIVRLSDLLQINGTGLSGSVDSSSWALSCVGSVGSVCPTFPAIGSPFSIGNFNYAVGQITIPKLAAGGSITVNLTVPLRFDAVCGPSTVTVDNFATLNFNGLYVHKAVPGHPNTSFATQQTVGIAQKPCVDIVAQKSVSSTSYAPGAPISFTIALSNSGASAAINIPFEDVLPAGVIYTSSSCLASGTANCGGVPSYAAGPNKVSLTVASLPTGGLANKVVITINGTATTDPTQFGGKTNTVVIPTNPANAAYLDTNATSNTTSQNFNIRGTADVSIEKTGSCSTHALSSPASYTLVIKNNGPDTVIGAIVKDPTVANLTISGATCSASTAPLGVCPTLSSAQTVTALQSAGGLIIPSLANGATVTLTLSGTFSNGVASVTNMATVTLPSAAYNADTKPNNNTDSCLSSVETAPVAILKTIAGAQAGTQGAVVITAVCAGVTYGPFTPLAANTPAGTYPIATIPNVPIGATCTVTETATGATGGLTASTTYTTSATGGTIKNGTVATVVSAAGAVPASVTFTNTYPPTFGSLSISKTIAGAAAGLQSAVTLSANCGGTTYGPFTVAAGATGTIAVTTINNIPAGVICSVTETANGSNGNVTATTSSQVNGGVASATSAANATIASSSTATVAFTNTYVRQTGGLTVTKAITGTAAGQQGAIQFNVQCGTSRYGPFNIPAGATGNQAVTTINALPAGAVCSVVESTPSSPANIIVTATVALNSGAASAGDTASVTVVANATQQIAFANQYEPGPSDVIINGTYGGACGLPNGALQGATVTLTSTLSGATYTTTTDASGNYLLLAPPGSYMLEIVSTDPGVPRSVQTLIIPVGANAITAQVLIQNCSIPTMNDYGLVWLSLVLLGLACSALRRKGH
jgi:uncharacterized repeat protein (TIGR01451 family)